MNPRAIVKATLTSLSIILNLSGCIPMGLPERFATRSYQTIESLDAPVGAIVLNAAASNTLETALTERRIDKESLGSQFLMVLFPLTRLYLPHGKESFFNEELIRSFVDRGIAVVDCKSESTEPTLQVIKGLELSQGDGSLAASAYDLFFQRYLSISGTLPLTLRGTFGSGSAGKEGDTTQGNALHAIVQFKSGEFASSAQAPLISQMLQDGWAEGFAPHASRFLSLSSLSPLILDSREGTTVLVPQPQITTQISPLLGKSLAESSGFPTSPLKRGEIVRLLQRGILSGIRGNEISTCGISSSLRSIQPWLHIRGEIQTLESTITQLTLNDGAEGRELSLRMELLLRDRPPGAEILFLKSCSVLIREIETFDGSLIGTVEAAAAIASDLFLVGNYRRNPLADFVVAGDCETR